MATTESQCNGSRPSLIAPRRRLVQWLTTLIILLIPWLELGGVGLLRVDVPGLSLHFLGTVVRIEEFYLLLLVAFAVVFAFLLSILILGRIWCGWLCPQTTLNDISEWCRARFKSIHNSRQMEIMADHSISFLLSLLVAANLLWYFVEPRSFFISLLSLEMHPVVAVSFVVLTGLVYGNLAFIKRLMCRDFCPYGRIQSALTDAGTLSLRMLESQRQRCIACNSCVGACPMGIDIRQGEQIACINCGRCLDACRVVMHRRGAEGLIAYTFGDGSHGITSLANPKIVLLGLLLLISSMTLVVAAGRLPDVTLKVAVVPTVGQILETGYRTTLINIRISNRTPHRQSYQLLAFTETGGELPLKGATRDIIIEGDASHHLDVVVESTMDDKPYPIMLRLLTAEGRETATAQVPITPLSSLKK